jgi:two-component system sensor histidine kinase TctE
MHPERPLLRTQLLTWLLVPLFALLTAGALVSYWVALDFSRRAHDRTLVEVAREVSLYLRAAGGAPALEMPAEARRLLLTDPVDSVFFEVSTGDGRIIAGDPIEPPRRTTAAESAREVLYDGEMNGQAVRVVELSVDAAAPLGRPRAVVRVAETKVKRTALAREILLSVVAPQVLLIAIAGLAVWVGVVRGLAPLGRLQRAIAARSHRDFSPVVIEGVPGEVGPLVDSINELLTRLDRVLTLQTRFVADAAHQLKTPVAVLATQLEVARREDDPARLRQSLDRMQPGLDRLSRLVSQLLSLARNEPDAVRAVTLVPVDLNELALEVSTSWVPQALKRQIDLGFEAGAGPAMIRGDPVRLRELLDNLLDNAVRYSREGGRVTVRVSAAPEPAVEINDDGPSVPPAEREQIFERFHRLLGGGRDGSGLGLAIAREIARLHDAEITLRDDADGIGNTFRVSFPPPPAGQPEPRTA